MPFVYDIKKGAGRKRSGGGEEGGRLVSAACSFRANLAFVDVFVHRVTCYWIPNAIALGSAEMASGTARSTVNKGRGSLEAERWSAA